MELGVAQEVIGRMGYVDVRQVEVGAGGPGELAGHGEGALAELGAVQGNE